MNTKRLALLGAAVVATGGLASCSAAHAVEDANVVNGCTATLSFQGSQATATPGPGCSTEPGQYLFISWVLSRQGNNHGEQVFDLRSSPPWVVDLPPCYYQVDFSTSAPQGQRKVIAGKIGTNPSCVPTTTSLKEVTTTLGTTTTTSSTTVVSTTTSSVAPTTTSTSTVSTTTTPIAPAPLPPPAPSVSTTTPPVTFPATTLPVETQSPVSPTKGITTG
jgi:hypothetical protein